MNKPIYLGLSILDISKTLIYEFWHNYIKPKYQNNAKLCYMDTDSFIIHIKTEDFSKDIADDIEERYDISDYKAYRPLPKEINKNAMDLIKDKLKGKIFKRFVALRSKAYSYLKDDDKNVKKVKGKKYVIKRTLKFDDYKDCLVKNESILKSQQRFKSEAHYVYTEEVNKIALRLQ